MEKLRNLWLQLVALENEESKLLDLPSSIHKAESVTAIQRNIESKTTELITYYSDNKVHGDSVEDFAFMDTHHIELHEQIIVELGYWRYQWIQCVRSKWLLTWVSTLNRGSRGIRRHIPWNTRETLPWNNGIPWNMSVKHWITWVFVGDSGVIPGFY